MPSDLSFLIPDLPPLEIFIRGTITYLFIFGLLRVLKRQSGALSIPDLLVIVLIADAAQNSMAGDYKSVGDGLLLVTTIAFEAYALDWLGYRFKRVERIIHPPPQPLIKDGRLIRRNMRAELVTVDEVMTYLRSQGIEKVEDVRRAFVEGNGEVSVIPYEQGGQGKDERRALPGG